MVFGILLLCLRIKQWHGAHSLLYVWYLGFAEEGTLTRHTKQTSATHPVAPKNAAAQPDARGIQHDEIGLERLVFFSDAVFAIAITLLALEIRLPTGAGEASNSELLSQLVNLMPKYLSYCISFFVIGTFWISHHRKFRYINRYDMRLLWLNLLLMMLVAFIPFPTSVLSESGNRTATIFYALTMVLVGVVSALVWWYAVHRNRLVSSDFTNADRRRGFVSSLIAPLIFLISIGIAFIDVNLAKYFWLLIAPSWIFVR